MKKRLLAPIAAALALAAFPASSVMIVDFVEAHAPPPAPQAEAVPAPVPNLTWIPGCYDYRDGKYVWVAGHFEPERNGYVYVPPRYADGKYYDSRWNEATQIRVAARDGNGRSKTKKG